jgi:anthranilate phosphoribosyltransferase
VHDSGLIEARILGVARKDIGVNFAEALRLSGAKKALVICGDENLDELSCAGPTHCWYINDKPGTSADKDSSSSEDSEDDKIANVEISNFMLSPADFGLPCHSLDTVHGGKGPNENAQILMEILRNERAPDDPVLQFVLLNTAALITVSGICEAEESHMGDGDDGKVVQERGPGGLRWKEGLRRAKWCIQSGAALAQWEAFVKVTNELEKAT